MDLTIFIFGAAIGSFLNVVILRLRSGQVEERWGIIRGRSRCPWCGQELKWHDLIPIISFLWLCAKCRTCGKKISWQYPLVEVATGLLFVLVFNYQFSNFNLASFFLLLYVLGSLVVIFVYDLKHFIIPDIVLFPAIGVAAVYRVIQALDSSGVGYLANSFLAAALALVFFLLIIWTTKGKGMGLGDAKLAFLLGLILGWPKILLALFLAFLFGAIVGVSLIIMGRKTMKSQIPFGPFLIAAALIALIWGQGLIEGYQNLLI